MFLCKDVPLCCYDLESKMKKIGDYMYRYDNTIGNGKFSKVYAGINTLKDQAVAIKVINLSAIKEKALLDLTHSQIQILSSLNQKNIIKCISVLKSKNNYYIIMELCQKDSLYSLLRKKGKFAQSEIQRYIYDIFLGLEYLSENNIIHRDIKTQNILIGESGKAKIADFGFATKTLTQINDIFIGTPQYMTPQALLNQVYSPKTDIWSFGILIYQLLHGFTPLSACENKEELLQRVCVPPRIFQNISESLRSFMESCLQINYHERISMYQLSKHPYILKLKHKFHINTQIFRPLTMTRNLRSARSQSHINQSDVLSTKTQKFPAHYQSLNLPEFQSLKMDYPQAASLIHYCRLVDKSMQLSYNQIVSQWLISLINMLQCESSLRRKSMTKLEYQKLRKVINGYHQKYHWRYSNLQSPNRRFTTKQIIYEINRIMRQEQGRLKIKTLFKYLEQQTLKLKKSLTANSLRYFQAETSCESIMKHTNNILQQSGQV